MIYEISNDKEVESIYEENTMGLKRDDWLELYHHATSKPYSFLYLNSQKEKQLRCMMNLEKVLFFDHEYDEKLDKNKNPK